MNAPQITDGPYVMGIDFGTESCRVAIVDLTGRPVAIASTGYVTSYPRPGQAEQSPDDWWEALVASTHKAMADAGIGAHAIAGISYDATTMTVVAMDERGNALRPAIMWMDVRATEQAARASHSDSPARRYNGGGSMPATAEWFPFKAAWLRENEPQTYRDAHRLVDAPDWLTFRLTGRWTANINSASLRAYYDRNLGGWPVDFYEEIGCGDVFDKVPGDVLDLGEPVGALTVAAATALGLVPGTPVAQGCADAWAGQIGLGVLSPGRFALITGSSHVLTGQTAQPVSGPGFFGAYTDGVLPGQYTVEGGQVSTGSVLKWFKDNFARDVVAAAERTGLNAYDILNAQSRDLPPGSEGLIICEYFQGNRTPYTDSKARGIISGLSLRHGPEHMYRAIQESVCYGTAHNVRVMAEAGIPVEELVVCGGATKSRDWIQMHADVTGVPITLTEVGDAVVLGTSMLAATGAGLFADLPTAAKEMVTEVDRIEPDQERHEEYQFFVDTYVQTYPQLKEQIHGMTDKVSAA
ncbi:xylulose kinase [Xylanimonas allomyrinae]|uniref:Xylulose kinase n=1 Tax=Xylanimonas allomyrinae TaxID=2509459 RepID=A0A4P6EKB5_9MICO|nr:FGGY-family carbohydrate kinase [Xylanimonas allomyrinae]QAY63130.1 xylulose kinase [Xylanimonas allomyrinae]